MRKIKYPLIVSDFDGTLVSSDGTVSQKNIDAISQYVKDGGHFAISTGRMPSGILWVAQALGLQGYVCTCQGAIIMDIQTKRALSLNPLSYEATLKSVEAFEKFGLSVNIYDEVNFYSNKRSIGLDMYEKAVRHKAIMVEDRPLSQYVKENKFRSFKVLAMVDPKDNDRIFNAMRELNIEGCEVTRSGESLVEIINANYSKGTSVKFLAEHFNVPLEKVIAVGDQLNDLPMIEAAGLGIAVRNGAEELKAKAVVCDKTNDEGAIAEIIEKYGYTEE